MYQQTDLEKKSPAEYDQAVIQYQSQKHLRSVSGQRLPQQGCRQRDLIIVQIIPKRSIPLIR